MNSIDSERKFLKRLKNYYNANEKLVGDELVVYTSSSYVTTDRKGCYKTDLKNKLLYVTLNVDFLRGQLRKTQGIFMATVDIPNATLLPYGPVPNWYTLRASSENLLQLAWRTVPRQRL